MDANKIVTKFEALVSLRKTPEQTWDLIEKLVMPIRGGKFFQTQSSEHEIEHRRPEIYDDTALIGADTLAAAIHGSLTSPAIRWFDLRFRNDELNKLNEAQRWIEDTRDKIYNALYDSNFDLEVAESYLDLVGFGNTCLIEEVEDDTVWKGIDFGTVPIREVFFEGDKKGTVLNFYRRLQMTALQIVDKFGDNVPEGMKEKSEAAGQQNNKMEVIYCIYKRYDVEEVELGQIVAAELRPYGTMYVMRESKDVLGTHGGAYEMPAFITQWRKTSGSQWGYGPGNLAIPTVTTLNTFVELVLTSAEKVIDPSLLVTERGLISDLDLTSGGVTVVRDLDRSMRPFESGAKFDVSAMQMSELRSQIRSIFRLDQLELKESPQMSATEASIRYELMNRILGPTLGRIEKGMLNPVVERTFNIMYRAGQLLDLPEVLQGADINIEYTGPLARAQKMDNVAAYERWLNTMGSMAEVFPKFLDLPDTDAIGREIAHDLGVPATGVKGEEQVKQERKEREAAQKKMQEAAIAEQQGNAAKAQGEGQQALNPPVQ